MQGTLEIQEDAALSLQAPIPSPQPGPPSLAKLAPQPGQACPSLAPPGRPLTKNKAQAGTVAESAIATGYKYTYTTSLRLIRRLRVGLSGLRAPTGHREPPLYSLALESHQA